jgi:DNA primase
VTQFYNNPTEKNKNPNYDSKIDLEKKVTHNDSIKFTNNIDYILVFDFNIKGKVAKNDIMGTVYNQGKDIIEDLTLEKLQNKRKLGRFQIDIVSTSSGTVGQLKVPIMSDKLEASIIAANLETVEKCGPFIANFKLKHIIYQKAKAGIKLFEKAKYIYETKFKESYDSISQFRDLLKASTSSIKYSLLDASANIYGGVHNSSKNVYIVEGLNDIKRLADLKIYNTVSVNGGEYNIETLQNILQGKELTFLFDNDKGGRMLEAELAKTLNPSYIIHLPDNQNVEECPKEDLFVAIYNKILYTAETKHE